MNFYEAIAGPVLWLQVCYAAKKWTGPNISDRKISENLYLVSPERRLKLETYYDERMQDVNYDPLQDHSGLMKPSIQASLVLFLAAGVNKGHAGVLMNQ